MTYVDLAGPGTIDDAILRTTRGIHEYIASQVDARVAAERAQLLRIVAVLAARFPDGLSVTYEEWDAAGRALVVMHEEPFGKRVTWKIVTEGDGNA